MLKETIWNFQDDRYQEDHFNSFIESNKNRMFMPENEFIDNRKESEIPEEEWGVTGAPKNFEKTIQQLYQEWNKSVIDLTF